MIEKKSLYSVTEHSRDRILNTGYDYKDNIFKKTMSSFIFKDDTRSSILSKMETVIHQLIENVKTIKLTFDYRKNKDWRKFN